MPKEDEPSGKDLGEQRYKQIISNLTGIIKDTKLQNEMKRDIRGVHEKIGAFHASDMRSKEQESVKAAYEKLMNSMKTGDKGIEATVNHMKSLRELSIREARDKGELNGVQILDARHGCLMLMNMAENKEPYGAGALQWPDSKRLEKNDEVAAFMSETNTWIVAEVFGPLSNHRYECIDVDDKKSKRLPFARRQLVPLPKYTVHYNIYPHMALPKNAKVLAVFPRTTCFYEGVVFEPPPAASGKYKIRFLDMVLQNEKYSPPVEVSERYVIPYRKNPKMYVRPEKRAQLEKEAKATKADKKVVDDDDDDEDFDSNVIDERDVPGPAPKARPASYYESPDELEEKKTKQKKMKVVREKKEKVRRARVPEHKKKVSTRLFGKRRRKSKKQKEAEQKAKELDCPNVDAEGDQVSGARTVPFPTEKKYRKLPKKVNLSCETSSSSEYETDSESDLALPDVVEAVENDDLYGSIETDSEEESD